MTELLPALSNRYARDVAAQTRLSSDIARTQIQISSGKKFAARSEAPSAARQVALLRQAEADTTAWQSNLIAGIARNAQADTTMRSAAAELVRARELVLNGTNGTATASDRAVIATELSGIADQIAALAASEAPDGAPLFATGAANAIRFGATETFAPVPDRESAFGNPGLDTIVREAADAFRSGDRARIDASLTAVSAAIDFAANAAADIGARGARMEAIGERLANTSVDMRAERSQFEDTDLNEAIARLNAQTLTLDAARAAFARINRETLFDLLR